MECRWFILCFWIFFLLFPYNGSLSCSEQERIGLLELKTSIIKDPYYHVDSLLTWVDDNKSDCCAWERVKCNNISRRVIQLFLNNTYDYSGFDDNVRLLNATLFLPFEELQHLDLSASRFSGWLPNQGLERLSKLKKLEDLGLSFNYFNNNILPSLGALTSLKTLDLEYNRLNGSLSEFFPVFTTMRNLEDLNLNSNHLDDFVTFHDLANMTKLKVLELSENNLSSHKIPPSILSLKHLQALSLRGNKLNNSISGFCELKTLRELDLRDNNFEGILPPCLNNLTSLRYIDFSRNQLSGNIPPSLTAGLTSLTFIDFSKNQFSGSITPFHIFNLTSLKYLSLSDNQFEGTLLFASVVESKIQLEVLRLSNCNLNTSTVYLLKFLNNQYNLRMVDLSHNKLHGKYPDWLVVNNTRLEALSLRNNSLNSHIHFPAKPHISLRWIDISNNNIQGQLQTNVGDVLLQLSYLNLSNNGFEGTIPSSISNLTEHLVMLDLSSNNFSGEIPPFLFKSSGLITLRLAKNHFTGFLPSHNHFTESFLFMLDISQNHISGRIPSWMGNLTHLNSLVLRDNSFFGPIPLQLCNLDSIFFLDLSLNNLSGSIPSCLNSTNLMYLHLEGNQLTGSLPKSIFQSSHLMTLDLNHNYLSGSIPNSFGLYQVLKILLLKGNHLSGSIPREMCRLNYIGMLDLSHNNFSGTIPPCFSNFTFETTPYLSLPTIPYVSLNSEAFWIFISNDYYTSLLDIYFPTNSEDDNMYQSEVEFMTKGRLSPYKGDILNYMTGMDLSSNHFTGDIPLGIGALTGIRALNLSHNQLTGSIPKTLSNLTHLESMDLSHNKLIGEIPPELNGIYTLAVFTVAYNNLSGRLPDNMKPQFSTFDETSYEGNPFLCGPPLQKQCNTATTTTPSVTVTVVGLGEKLGIDPVSFLASFAASCVVTLLGLVTVLYINPYWRRLWFDFVDACLSFMLPFCSETIYKVSNPCT